MSRMLMHNGRVHTQADSLVVDSIAIHNKHIVAVGNRLEKDREFKEYSHFNLNGLSVTPGFVDAHTHFYYHALLLGRVSLEGLTSRKEYCREIERYAKKLSGREWLFGGGYALDRITESGYSPREVLDSLSGNRVAFVFAHDQHSAWVNSKALKLAGISSDSNDPRGGAIGRMSDGSLSGILYEQSAYMNLLEKMPKVSKRKMSRLFDIALEDAYRKGVTGVHSFDGTDGYLFFKERASRGKLGLRINYYLPATELSLLDNHDWKEITDEQFLRLCGVKLFSDGALGSQTALCFHKYIGSKENYGIEVTSQREMLRLTRKAARHKLPVAIHAIGDRAVSNVLDVLETVPPPRHTRHRIEHLQLIRRKDIARLKRQRIVASMQPSHCPSDIRQIEKFWGKRGRNTFLFRSLIDKGVNLAFGSDVPIERLNPIEGMAAAVRRIPSGSRIQFYPDERISGAEALYHFTVGPAIACGEEQKRGYLLPGYTADLVILDQDITRIAANRIGKTVVLVTLIDGKVKYQDPSLSL